MQAQTQRGGAPFGRNLAQFRYADHGCALAISIAQWNMEREARLGGHQVVLITWKDSLYLIDLGFSGPKFTWNYGTDSASRRSTRLDRCLCDEEWRRAFSEVFVKNLPHSYLDHCPLLLQLSSKPA